MRFSPPAMRFGLQFFRAQYAWCFISNGCDPPDDSSIYPPDEFLHEDDPSRQYQIDSDISYYVIPHGRSLTKLTQENHIPKVIVPNELDVLLTEDTEDPPDLINTEGIHEQNIQDEQITTQTPKVPSGSNTEEPSRNNTDVSVPISESSVSDVP
ncbi:hypothetical protein Tco_1439121 [Tanacetum coccineum]